MHLVSLYELNQKNELFSIAHELVDQHPKHAIAWFGVGVYYYLIANYMEARRYFGKASTIDSHYGPAWIGFGHSFALEGEHDQAIAAYATSMKLFQGSHLGSMYIGMQHLQQNNVVLAEKYLTGCLTICDSDPLLLNEVAVVHYNQGRYEEAVEALVRVIQKLERSHRKNVIWETTWLNLGHAYRKLGNYSDAERYFLKVDGITGAGPAKASALVGLGFIYHIMGQIPDAIECYHKVLVMRPGDQVATDMLKRIMEDRARIAEMEWMHDYLPDDLKDDDEVERRVRISLDNIGGSRTNVTADPTTATEGYQETPGASSSSSGPAAVAVSTGRPKRKGSVSSMHSAKGARSRTGTRRRSASASATNAAGSDDDDAAGSEDAMELM
ncbi:anaphase promoting complex subunit cdc16 [Mortierella sp. GBA43]|nr:anaphase promoting complex subunit cdc16 [Mortierella sp. GBA43]